MDQDLWRNKLGSHKGKEMIERGKTRERIQKRKKREVRVIEK